MRCALRAVLAFGLICGVPRASRAQEPTLKPLTEHLAGIQQDSIGVLRYTARRCAALYVVVAEAASGRSAELAAQYRAVGPTFVGLATKAERALGSSEQEATDATQTAVLDIARIYLGRIKRNMALTGSYFADDPLIVADMQVCGKLAAIQSGPSGATPR